MLELMLISFTQYDCSSADINPIGSISKQDLRSFLRWAAINLGFSSLADIEAAPPTAELEPIRSDYSQVMDFLSFM
jgi:NAD+ synthase (glutamine-hydrolysing)